METLLPLLGFAIAASVTPGPNTLMVAAMAARGGARAPLPAMLGISAGFVVLLLVVALGLAAPLAASPAAQSAMRWVGAGWLLWLAFRIGTAPPPAPGAPARVMGFWAAAAFQWVNPKAWLVGLAAMAAFSVPGEGALAGGLRIALAFGVVSLPCLAVWVALGLGAGRALRTPRAWRVFNAAMGLLLAASLLPLLG
ncbi:LysE family translocator [Teichococcus aestuarii]|uniref:LysE family translocator n=1 Tax=Teichococcus aestuarii TaxID=568898 RepID=UPI0036191684